MTTEHAQTTPIRGSKHDALDAFLGDWKADGDRTAERTSEATTGRNASVDQYFIGATGIPADSFFQDEKALPGGETFDTLTVMGVDVDSGEYFARNFENHGFYRKYDVTVDDRAWSIRGATERAQIEFSEDGRTQTIVWEWKPRDRWLPLCDRTARRIG